MGYKWGKMPNLGLIENCERNIPTERANSKLSENHNSYYMYVLLKLEK